MITTFAHTGHAHTADTVNETGSMLAVYHCMPILVGALVVIALLLGVILYLIHSWQPKPKKRTTKKK